MMHFLQFLYDIINNWEMREEKCYKNQLNRSF